MKFLFLIFLFFNINLFAKNIYILKSSATVNLYKREGLDHSAYLSRIQVMSEIVAKMGYKIEVIDDSQISKLNSNDILLMFDTLMVEENDIESLINFVKNGGGLLFNFNAAFNKKAYLINTITKLEPYTKYTHIDYKKNTGFGTPKILSPITSCLPNGERLDLVLYEKLPIFKAPKNLEPDMLATNWQQASTITIEENKKYVPILDSGIIWHGSLDKGKWVYTNFASYTITDSGNEQKYFVKLLKGMIEYLSEDVIVRKYPYLDKENVVFVSEDTEYQYPYFKGFFSLANEYQFPLTAFCVANLSKENIDIFNQAANSKYIEIASHSTTHQKIIDGTDEFIKSETEGSKTILDSLNKNVNVRGFRPPGEELNDKMIKNLINSKYIYLMEQNKGSLYPFFEYKNLLTIPRAATDDYQYLVLLDWNQTQILDQMISETNVLTYLNGVYAFSMHTHLLAFHKNINVLEKYIKYVKSNQNLTPMFGNELVDKSIKTINIDISFKQNHENSGEIVINNKNSKVVENFTFRLYLKPKHSIKSFDSPLQLSYKKRENLDEYNVVVAMLQPNSINKIKLNY